MPGVPGRATLRLLLLSLRLLLVLFSPAPHRPDPHGRYIGQRPDGLWIHSPVPSGLARYEDVQLPLPQPAFRCAAIPEACPLLLVFSAYFWLVPAVTGVAVLGSVETTA